MKVSRRKFLMLACVIVLVSGLLASWLMGSFLTAPRMRSAGPLPADLPGETVTFTGKSAANLQGWYIPASAAGAPTIILMHGVGGHRTDMLGRAHFLHRAGYAVLLFDFRGHGESPGTKVSFGYFESQDAAAAVDFVRHQNASAKIGLLGVSMGGAAAVLANPSLPVQAMILESVYPDIVSATEDRIAMRLGPLGRILTPLLTCQLQLRLGISCDQLRPIGCVSKITVPKFFLAGTEDKDTTLPESKALFAAAAAPKQFWAVDGAAHVDLHAIAKQDYEKRVLAFFQQTLK
jgi:uncharacterized protein